MADITSLSTRVLNYGLGTDILYPSNSISSTDPIENPLTSIAATIAKNSIDILDFVPKNSYLHSCGKPVRIVARMIYAKAVYTIVSPVGMLYHGTATNYYLTKWTFVWLFGYDNLPETAEKIQGHALACLTETSSTVFNLGTVVFPYIGYQAFLLGRIRDVAGSAFITLVLASRELSYGINPLIFTYAFNSGFYKSVFFRNHFDLSGKTTGLLPTGPEDREAAWSEGYTGIPPIKGTVRDLWKQEATAMLDIIRDYNIAADKVGEPLIRFNNYSVYTPLTILESLKLAEAQLEAASLKPNVKKELPNIDEMLKNFRRYQERCKATRMVLAALLNAQEFLGADFVSEFPFLNSECDKHVTPKSRRAPPPPPPRDYYNPPQPKKAKDVPLPRSTRVARELRVGGQPFSSLDLMEEKDKDNLTPDYFRTAEAHATYHAFKRGVLDGKTDRELLDLLPGYTRKQLRFAYFDLTRILHADTFAGVASSPRLNAKQKQEVDMLFKCLGAAYISLLAAL